MIINQQKYVLPDGQEVTIRSAIAEDAQKVVEHREAVAAETHFMARYPEDGPFNLERTKGILEGIAEDEKDFMVNAYIGDEMVGDLAVRVVRPHIKFLHRGYLGVSIRQQYAGLGLGSFMMQTALNQAKENGFEQVELGVFSDNDRARHLYSKFGFQEYGKNPRAFKLKDGTYRDEIIMVKIF